MVENKKNVSFFFRRALRRIDEYAVRPIYWLGRVIRGPWWWIWDGYGNRSLRLDKQESCLHEYARTMATNLDSMRGMGWVSGWRKSLCTYLPSRPDEMYRTIGFLGRNFWDHARLRWHPTYCACAAAPKHEYTRFVKADLKRALDYEYSSHIVYKDRVGTLRFVFGSTEL
jgi:hypothetical protein